MAKSWERECHATASALLLRTGVAPRESPQLLYASIPLRRPWPRYQQIGLHPIDQSVHGLPTSIGGVFYQSQGNNSARMR